MRPWFAFLAVAAVCAGILLVGDAAQHLLRYERDALLDGQLWRGLTGHLVHFSRAHLGLNLAVGAFVVFVFRRHVGWGAPLLVALGTSAGLFLFALRVKWYGGLSGVLHGLIVFGALAAWRRDRRPVWLVAVMLVIAKLVVEAIRQTPGGVAELIGVPVVPQAHVYGAISGALAFALLYRPRRGAP